MEQERLSQNGSLNDASKRFRPLRSQNQERLAPTSSDEGGLNLSQVGVALLRRLPIVIGITTVVSSAAILRASTSKPIYQSQFEILTKPVTVEGQVLSSVPQSLSNKEQQQQQQSEKQLDETKLKLLKSPKILDPIARSLQPKYPELTFDELAGKLVVSVVPSSEILSVSFQDQNAVKVRDVLQQVSTAYLNYSLEERLADIRQGIEFVDNQLPQLQQRVATVQDQLQRFRQQNNLIDPESTSNQLAEQITELGKQRITTEIELKEAESRSQDLAEQRVEDNQDEIASSVLSDNPRYQDVLKQLLETEVEMAKKTSTFLPKAPQVEQLVSQLANLQPLLTREQLRSQNEADGKVRELQARQQILAQTEAVLNQQVKQLSVTSRQYADLQQELKIATENLNQFLTKREALRIDAGQRKTPWQILTPPVAPKPSAGSLRQSAVLGVILGLLLGIGAALLLEKLSSVLRTTEEVKDVANLPILGTIPFTSELVEYRRRAVNVPQPLPIVRSTAATAGLVDQVRQRFGIEKASRLYSYYSGSEFLEEFRSLCTNIRLLNPDHQVRSLVIGSSTAGEGKSTIALNLAQAAAALGQRVLLVDTDLRKPQLHLRANVLNACGLSNLVSGEVELEEAIQGSALEPNLAILTAGQTPPDPVRLLSSKRMHTLMSEFEEQYDLVIYDTPPLNGLSDAKLLSAHTDGIIIVVGLDKTKSAEIQRALEALKLSSVTPLGIVTNSLKG